ncbi:S8 family serine peptidase [Flavisolibacter sp. BT320]|nr:S8 family serine peptidase [Flavisolibacter longurius]
MPRNRLLLFFFLLFTTSLFSQPVYLRTGPVQPKGNISTQLLDSFARTAPRFAGSAFAVIRFDALPTTAEKEKLQASGITLLDYLPQNAFIAAIRNLPSAQLLRTVKASAIFPLTPQQKMPHQLAKGKLPSWAVKTAGTVDLWLSFYKTLEADLVLQELSKLGVDVIATNHIAYRIIGLHIAQDRINEIAALPFVEFIQAAPPKDQPLNDNSLAAAKAAPLIAPVVAGGRGLTGEGVAIGHGDNADLQAHADFSGRLINHNASPFNAHGVHTAGIMAGAGVINELYRGFAPKASIISHSFSGIVENATTYIQDYGMVITNNSYGNIIECEYHGTYDLTSRILDQQMLDNPSLLHVFSAGNSGNANCPPYPAGYRTVLGGYQVAKNIVTVGATNDSGAIAPFSSRGPALDGRLKPEIMAMGQNVISSWPTNTYQNNNGTSMSAPAVSGGLALIYQRYRQLHNGTNPKNGLMKALLCNGASERGAAGPDFMYGFGSMNLLRSVVALEEGQYFTGNSTQGAIATHTISVPAGTARLKVLLYWNDLPASVISTKNLVHDLDLEVVDPAGNVIRPLVLDTSLAALDRPAVTGADHVNNMEQVVIPTPVAGQYTLRVKGSTVTTASQEYFLAFDPVPVHLTLTAPFGGEALVPGESTKISWDSDGLTGTAILEFSPDGGATWSAVETVDVARTVYTWTVPTITSANARVRITKTGSNERSASQPFSILGAPVVSLAPVQCEDYIALTWTTVTGATDYEVMLLRNDEMVPVATTNATAYTLGGLSKDSLYFVSVRARLDGKPGRRARAISRTPSNGNCTGTISNNDIKIDAILSPRSGRKETSTELSNTEKIRVRIKNLDDAPAASFTVAYRINGQAPVIETVTVPVAARASYDHIFATPADLSATGKYNLVVYVTKASDTNKRNDTLRTNVQQIANLPLSLTSDLVDNLEAAEPETYQSDTTGIRGAERYDFSRSTAFGRLRTFAGSGTAFSGRQAFTLDANRFVALGNVNYLYGTYNLRNYSATTHDVRLDFRIRQHGQIPNPANRVWIRGSDSDAWVNAFNLDSLVAGNLFQQTKSIEVSGILAANGQNFTSSFGVRWGQWGIWPATDTAGGAGYTIDDIRLYQVQQDVQLESILSPAKNACGQTGAATVQISVRNGSPQAITGVPVRYRIDGGAWVSESIASLPARSTQSYTFNTTADLSALGPHTVEAIVDLPVDNFRVNDTVTVVIYNQPLVTSFPYLENFESSNGYFYAEGNRSSWAWGTPNSRRIKGAASRTKAWKTNLEGTYTERELSYLYSPCFNLAGMSKPTLSFSVALDIEDCGTALCDAAWVEYSSDGLTWEKLGTSGSGTNWYNKAAPRENWSVQNYTNWHVATQALPTGVSNLRLRFVLSSDEGVTREGIAIDDIHIYDNPVGIADGLTQTAPVTQPVAGNNWQHFIAGNGLMASVQPVNQNLGATAVQAFLHTGAVRFDRNQYYLDRNLTIQAENMPTDSVWVRYYFLDKEADTLLKATGCPSCYQPSSAYELGITQYTAPAKSQENGTLADNLGGLWKFIPPSERTIVPFDKGYYAEFKTASFSEFWLNSGGADRLTPLPVKMISLTATRQGTAVLLQWKVGSETDVARYEVELARGPEAAQANRFEKIGEVISAGDFAGLRDYSFTDAEQDKFGARYYRLKIVDRNGSFQYSPVRMVPFEEALLWQVYPNPGSGAFSLLYQLEKNNPVQARLYDAKGRLVKEFSTVATGFPQKLSIDISANNYASGLYLLKMAGGNTESTFKLYKQ